MAKARISRRKALQIGTAAAALPLVHIRTAGAAGKLAVAFWDHWVPTGNDVMRKQVAAWSEKNKVEVQADFLNQSLLPTAAAEQQARAGHDIYSLPTWEVHNHQDALEPVDDVVKSLTDAFGKVNSAVEYLGKVKGHWLAVPGSSGTQIKGPCGRISLLKQLAGLDVLEMYPAKDVHTAAADAWTYDAHLKAAEACFKGGKPFGMGLGQTSDSVDSIGAIFTAYGAELVNAKGDITVKSDAVHQVLEYCQKLIKFFPPDCVSYDDASNNKALISGQAALIWNPPSAWAVAVRDQPEVGKDCWTFPAPAGPKGRFTPYLPYYWGIWNFSSNKTAAKELITYLLQKDQVRERCSVVMGYDLPPYAGMLDFKVWEEQGPPVGTVFNYPLRDTQHAVANIAASSAPPDIAVQIFNRGTMPTMLAKLLSGQSIEQVIAWANDELEGFAR
jgi:ABC-type glycerol-3-phosphate transport system substrate-binding protein